MSLLPQMALPSKRTPDLAPLRRSSSAAPAAFANSMYCFRAVLFPPICCVIKARPKGLKPPSECALNDAVLWRAPRVSRVIIICWRPRFSFSSKGNSTGLKPTCTVAERAPSPGAELAYVMAEGVWRPRIWSHRKERPRVQPTGKMRARHPHSPAVFGYV